MGGKKKGEFFCAPSDHNVMYGVLVVSPTYALPLMLRHDISKYDEWVETIPK